MRKKFYNIISHPFFISTIALIFGLIKLARYNLWGDELFTFYLVDQSFSDMIQGIKGDIHPPLYYISLHFLIKFAGTSEVALRSLSAICGAVASFYIYRITAHLHDRTVAAVTTYLLILNLNFIQYQQETRGNMMMFLFIAAATYYAILYIETQSNSNLFLTACVAALALYTHYHSFFAFMVLPLSLIPIYRAKVFRLIKPGILAAIFFAPWSLVFIKQLQGQYGTTSPSFPDFNLENLFMVVIQIFGQIDIVIYSVLVIYIIYRFLKKQTVINASTPVIQFSILWVFLTLTFAAILSKTVAPLFYTRSFLYILIGSSLLKAQLLQLKDLRYRRLLMGLVLLSNIALVVRMHQIRTYNKPDFQKAINFLRKQPEPVDTILANTGVKYSLRYYARGWQPEVRLVKGAIISASLLKDFVGPVWLVNAYGEPQFPKNIKVLESKKFHQIFLYKIEKNSSR